MRQRESVCVEPAIWEADNARIDPVTAFARFLDGYPDYCATSALDELRAVEHGRLESKGQARMAS
jgi:hypothetical protein